MGDAIVTSVTHIPWGADMHTAGAVARACGARVVVVGHEWEFIDRRINPPRVFATDHGKAAPKHIHKWVRRLISIYASEHPDADDKFLLEARAGDELGKIVVEDRKAAEAERARRLAEEATRKGMEEETVGAPMTDERHKAKKAAVDRIFKEQARLGLTNYDVAGLLGVDVSTIDTWKQGGNAGAALARLEEWGATLASMESPPSRKDPVPTVGPAAPVPPSTPTPAPAPEARVTRDVTPAIMDGRLTLNTMVPVTYRGEVPVTLTIDLRAMESSELLALQVQVNTEVMRRVRGAGL